MNPFQIAYIPIGVPTFHLESAAAQFEQSAALLREISPDAAVPEKMLLSLDDLIDIALEEMGAIADVLGL